MFEFRPISAHIYRLELPWRVYGLVNIPVAVWMVRVGDRWTLVDSGPPETADNVVSAVARATQGRGVQSILLTHAHYDHAGGLMALRAAWNPAILCHRDEVAFVTGQAHHRQIRSTSRAFQFGRQFLPTGSWRLPVSRDLERGQSAEGMAVIHLPGHTPGQIGFLHPEDRAMICGDAVMNLTGRLSAPFALSTPDPEAARASIDRLGELDFEHLLPSHGPAILGRGRAAMSAFLRRPLGERGHTAW
jgi:glyoxylase-like metal-dependent hydrolase (beta-lactamase superfamily II)